MTIIIRIKIMIKIKKTRTDLNRAIIISFMNIFITSVIMFMFMFI